MASRPMGNITAKGFINMTGGANSYLRVPTLTTAQRDALTPANGMTIYNSDTECYEVYYDGSWKAINKPYEFVANNTTQSIGAYSSYALAITLDKKGYTKGYVHLLGLTGYGSFIKFSNDGSFATVESSAYGLSYDSAVSATIASSRFYDGSRTYISVYAITLNADGDTLTITFKNYHSSAVTLYLQKARGIVW